MHRYRLLLLNSLAVMLFGAVAHAETFEGIVHFKNVAGETTLELDYLIKGNKTRIDTGGEGARANVILDQEAKSLTVVVPERKMVMEMPLDYARPDQQSKKPVNFVKTGTTDTILGYTCEQLIAKLEEGEVEVCGVKGLGSFTFSGMHRMGRPGSGGPSGGAPTWTKALREQGLFPLRVVTKGPDGHELSRMEATNIEKKPLDANLFAVPADYQKFDMGSMMRGMGSPGGTGRMGRGE